MTKLNKFLKEKAFSQYAKGIEIIKDDFIRSGYEQFLWIDSLTEFEYRKKTTELIKSRDFICNDYIEKFLEQFSTIKAEDYIFVFPESVNKNYYIAQEIVKKTGGEIFIVNNIFPEDETVNYVAKLDSNVITENDITLLHHIVYSSNLYGNFGGYKLFGKDILYYSEFCRGDKIVYKLEYGADNYPSSALFYYQGIQTIFLLEFMLMKESAEPTSRKEKSLSA